MKLLIKFLVLSNLVIFNTHAIETCLQQISNPISEHIFLTTKSTIVLNSIAEYNRERNIATSMFDKYVDEGKTLDLSSYKNIEKIFYVHQSKILDERKFYNQKLSESNFFNYIDLSAACIESNQVIKDSCINEANSLLEAYKFVKDTDKMYEEFVDNYMGLNLEILVNSARSAEFQDSYALIKAKYKKESIGQVTSYLSEFTADQIKYKDITVERSIDLIRCVSRL